LNQLVKAEKSGEVEAFIARSAMSFRDGQVEVTIWTMPDQTEVAVEAVVSVGGEVTSILNNKALFGAWIPITKLESLASEKSIRKIERPVYGVPANQELPN